MPERTIAVVDGNSLLHRAFHALPETLTAPDGTPTNAVYGFVQMLVKLVQELHPDGVVVAFDKGKPAFRTEALAAVQGAPPAHRRLAPRAVPGGEVGVGGPLGPHRRGGGLGGRRHLGTLARRAFESGLRVLLVTGDRDAFQLVNDSVRVVTTKKGLTDIAEYGPAEVLERYGVTPAQIADFLGLKGDASDNIPGVPGIGEKTAARLLQEHGTLDAVLEAADGISGKLGENLREHAEAARASRTVATISTDVPVDLDLTEVRFGGFDPARVAAAFRDLRFTSLLERVLALALEGFCRARGDGSAG